MSEHKNYKGNLNKFSSRFFQKTSRGKIYNEDFEKNSGEDKISNRFFQKTSRGKIYKQNFLRRTMDKRGQTSMFVIIGVLVVAAVILVVYLFPGVRTVFTGEVVPNTFLESCIEDEIESNMDLLARQGGYENPEGFILYQGNRVKYLCYNAQYHKICNVQQPMIKAQFEKELGRMIKARTEECVGSLKNEFERKGYEVTTEGVVEPGVLIVPGKVIVSVNAPITVSKETSQSFRDFTIEIPSEMYKLLMTTTSIIDYESTYGDAEVTFYTQYYPSLIIQKNKLGDGSTIYGVRDVTTEEEFTFASRSLAWPGGYGIEA